MAVMGTFGEAVGAWAAGGGAGAVRELAARVPVRTAVLLEGASDVAAVRALARARGRDLAAEGVCVLPMGGAMAVGRFAGFLGPSGLGLRLTGMCDVAERPYYVRGFTGAGADGDGFSVCVADLEDELIRALGVARVEEVVQAQGELRALRTLQQQPAQRGRPPEQQVRRFLGSRKGRKIHYGRVLTEALSPGAVPASLEGLFARL